MREESWLLYAAAARQTKDEEKTACGNYLTNYLTGA